MKYNVTKVESVNGSNGSIWIGNIHKCRINELMRDYGPQGKIKQYPISHGIPKIELGYATCTHSPSLDPTHYGIEIPKGTPPGIVASAHIVLGLISDDYRPSQKLASRSNASNTN